MRRAPGRPAAGADRRPELLVGTMGPRTVQHAARWADGLAGVTLDLDAAGVAGLFELAAARGRRPAGARRG